MLFDSCDTDFLSCVSCCNILHYSCIHAAGILTSSWNTSKPIPKYASSIFEYDNLSFTCKSCNVNTTYISITSLSKQIDDINDFLINNSLSKKLEELNNKFDTRNE